MQFFSFLITGFLLVSSVVFAQSTSIHGINSTTSDLPMGASGRTILTLTSTGSSSGIIRFLHPHSGAITAYIDTANGLASFGNITGPTNFSGKATFLNGVKISGYDDAYRGLVVDYRIQSGPSGVGGQGGLYVGPAQYFGSYDNTRLGIWNNGYWGVLVNNYGNVGIGTVNPIYKLDVTGEIRSTSTISGSSLRSDYLWINGAVDALNAYRLNTLIKLANTSCGAGQALSRDSSNNIFCVTATGGSGGGGGGGSTTSYNYYCDAAHGSTGKVLWKAENGVSYCKFPVNTLSTCPAGQAVTSFDAVTETLHCGAPLADQVCTGGKVLTGYDADGLPQCGYAVSNSTCEVGKVVVGFANGVPQCGSAPGSTINLNANPGACHIVTANHHNGYFDAGGPAPTANARCANNEYALSGGGYAGYISNAYHYNPDQSLECTDLGAINNGSAQSYLTGYLYYNAIDTDMKGWTVKSMAGYDTQRNYMCVKAWAVCCPMP